MTSAETINGQRWKVDYQAGTVSFYDGDYAAEWDKQDLAKWVVTEFTTMGDVYHHLGLPSILCARCGQRDTQKWMEPTLSEMLARQACFSCNHWAGLAEVKDQPHVMRTASWQHYMIGKEPTPGAWEAHRSSYGFSGHRFEFRRFDNPDVIVVSHNVMTQGTIPELWREQLPPNAETLPTGPGW